ncbi:MULTISPECIES: NAD(P)(+) transhydrogenase (Re/Si-specific) subunit beta [Aequorivita]|uniref:NAD(P) transhydrogenase subunit beta n=1 Tax=Aequorivita iocasae TaxID=2803865 RepID=A0ABX7DVU5_9FLAO|nr:MULTISPECIES: NAD(P)(+) transhydrogenase (Re/Si-specific) subunit beta [Aequorivita]QQX77289.1 NAD(P)(+) transhydrogenase (Re/Si-specific) subunit beta [Aequorivita iocasae]UCA56778.1 NAD(P)(+) transhydrogenase (Re/Si-specific) subunit beta [Aequorivita sp. F7]
MHAIIEIGYLIATLSFLGGLKFMSSPKRAKTGNLIAALGMVLAVILTFFAGTTETVPYTNLIIMVLAITVGTLLGKRLSDKVQMTGMPQLVSLFNATGGGCAMLLGLMEANQIKTEITHFGNQVLLIAGLTTGAIALTGSIIAERKLAGTVKDKRGRAVIFSARILLALLLLLPTLYFLGFIPLDFMAFMYILAIIAMVYGVLFVLPIGGADMPVVISLLNSITGIATAFAGFVYGNKAMIAGGIFVGAAGILLTLLMCRAMNRSLLKVLAGTFKNNKTGQIEEDQQIKEISIPEAALTLSFVQKVAIVPGYGLAVAQAQHICAQLQQLLEKRNVSIDYIIHPVAGRMPGHMNVLLAEANVDYACLKEMEESNENMKQYDAVLVLGANDVVNPAAESNPNSPIYGMPIIRTHKAKQVIVVKRSMNKGYAGVQNELFGMDNCSILFGDAKTTLQDIVNQLKLL